MATSGSVNFSMNLVEIITDAYEDIGLLGAGEALSSHDLDKAKRKANMMVKGWMADGIKLWALKESTLFLSVGTAQYSLGSTHCTDSYVQTTLSADAAASATSLSLTSTTGMSASDNIGIVLDDGTIHWTTISGAPGAPTTIATGLASAASDGAVVFTYTTRINRPQRIVSAYRRDINGYDTPVTMISRQEYADQGSKSSRGKTIQAYYNPQLTNGVLNLWPTPDIATDVIRFWQERALEDFDTVTDNPDFPIEWAEAIVAGLRRRLTPANGISGKKREELLADEMMALDRATSYDRETESVFFQPA